MVQRQLSDDTKRRLIFHRPEPFEPSLDDEPTRRVRQSPPPEEDETLVFQRAAASSPALPGLDEPSRATQPQRIEPELEHPASKESAESGMPAEVPQAVGPRVSDEQLAFIVRTLAVRFGAIAEVIVRRSAKKAESYEDLCISVSGHIESPSDKACFLKEVGF